MSMFSLIFKSLDNTEFILDFEVYDTDIAARWFATLVQQCAINPLIKEPDRIYNLPNTGLDLEYIANEINDCIEVINSEREYINIRAEKNMDQIRLNQLHLFFEQLRGGVLSPGEYFINANQQQKIALERYNVMIHRAESFKNGSTHTRLVSTFINNSRYPLLDSDYNYFTMVRKFGEVYINYCEVGKPLYDVFKDNDLVVTDQNIRPLRYYSPAFHITFHERSQYNVDKFMLKFNQWWDNNNEKLLSLGFTKNDPKNAIGLIPVAKLITDIEPSELLNQLQSHSTMDRVITQNE